ncbi:MAG: protein translocase subunit SecD, partial [Phycisphaerales bacterium]|nr:protein translocase subunit SecD [Phycisphaerales bacterium]
MQNIGIKIALIVFIIGLCLWSMFPLKERIRLGKDLRGGVSLIYTVDIAANADNPQEILAQTITVLKERINPTGVLDISMEPIGRNRIEIVMPLPNDEVKALQEDYKVALEALLEKAAIPEAQLIGSLENGTAVAQWGGAEGTARYEIIAQLQTSHDEIESARLALKNLDATPDADAAVVRQAQFRLARALDDYDRRLDLAKRQSLPESRLTRALGLSNDPQKVVNELDQPVIDPETGRQALGPSPREIALDGIRADFAYIADELDDLIVKYNDYQAKRTGFDDPEDLMRLLRGAGVLEFHIAVTPSNLSGGLDVAAMRESLQSVGPDNTESTVARWFPINNVEQWVDQPGDLKLIQDNPEAFFARRALFATEYDGIPFVLLYTTDDKEMTHAPGKKKWSVTSTFPTVDQLGRPAAGFRLDQSGGGLMAKLTGAHVGEPMAIVLDGEIYTAPNLNSMISDSGIIQGSFSKAQLDYLTRVLTSGTLEARLSQDPIAMNTLGPSIGADNLNRGMWSFVIAVIAVCVFMLMYYFFAGLVANIALLANGIMIFGFMAMISGTFTLPGLAGIVLTIGMAVDANVLIYERIREEIMEGVLDLRGCIREGYGKALSTILDANITNLIVCAALAQTATTEVKGFAITLSIGIAATLFTALFVTRQIYYLYTDWLGRESLPMLPSVVPWIHRTLEPNINWIGLRKIFWVISGSAIIASLVLIYARGTDMFDTEFRGGVSITMRTRLADPGSDSTERLQLVQSVVNERIHEVAQKAATDAGPDSLVARVASEVQRANVLTVGSTTVTSDGELACERFQIKVATPKGVADDEDITPAVSSIINEAFGSELDITRPLVFDGVTGGTYAEYTYPIESAALGDNINMPSKRFNVADYIGGVAVVIANVDPPASPEDVASRIERMRNQPDFADTLGRQTTIIPLNQSADGSGSTDLAILVFDDTMNYRDQDDYDLVNTRLAQREWELAKSALAEGSTFEQVSSYSSSVAKSLAASAIVAVTLTLLGILVYIWVRFGSLRYSVAAIVALMHEFTIALGLLALTSYIARSGLGGFVLG